MLCPCSNIKIFLLWLEKETFRLMDDWLKPQETQILSFSSWAAYWEPGHTARISMLGNNEGNLPVIQVHEKKSADSPQPHPPYLKTFGKCKPGFFISKSECFNHNSIFRVPKTVTHYPQWAHRDVLTASCFPPDGLYGLADLPNPCVPFPLRRRCWLVPISHTFQQQINGVVRTAHCSDGEKWNEATSASSSALCLFPSFSITSDVSDRNLPCGTHILCLRSYFPAEVINVQFSAS